jgi:hypothetical protein
MSVLSISNQRHSGALPLRPDESVELNQRANTLVEVAEQLGKVRNAAETTGDSLLLYLIGMAIVHVRDSVCAAARPGIVDDLEGRRIAAGRACVRRGSTP